MDYYCVLCGAPAGILPVEGELKCVSCDSKTIIWGSKNDQVEAHEDYRRHKSRWRRKAGEGQV